MKRIFVIDDEAAMGENIQRMLKFPETTVTAYTDPVKGLADALARPPELVLLDMRMPGMAGEEVFARLHQAQPELPIVFFTAFGSVEGAVLAMRSGAFDYLQKPFKRDDLLLVVKRALAHAELKQEVERLQGRLEALGETDHPQSRSAVMRELTGKAQRAAATDATVMILGESGTGKEVMARYIQSQSPRKNRAFVPVECSALPGSLIESELFGYERGAFTGADRTKKGLIESADGGTLFLDELASTSPAFQASLLRVLQSGEVRRVGSSQSRHVNVRVIGASNLPLSKLVSAGSFRADLYYRLSVLSIELPPLRERAGDVEILTAHFLRLFQPDVEAPPRLTREATEALAAHDFPGNVRELENALRRAIALSSGLSRNGGSFTVTTPSR